jgi:hypothetical protein
MTKLNKDFHTEFQPIGFTAYRLKSGIACQTSTYRDYLNLQSFLKQRNVPFNLIRLNASKPYRVVIRGVPPYTPPNTIREELSALGFAVKLVTPMTSRRDRSPLHMFIIDLENIPQSHKISQLRQLCYIKITVEPYKSRIVPPQSANCQQFYHVAANSHAKPVCAHCSLEHNSWLCTIRHDPNFTPSCTLCKLGDHGARYRGCPYFQSLMDKGLRNKPHIANQHNSNRQVNGRRQISFPSNNYVGHPSQTLPSSPPATSVWTKPLSFASSQPTPPPHPHPFNTVPTTTYPSGTTDNTFFPPTGDPAQSPGSGNQTQAPPQPPDRPRSHTSSANLPTSFPPPPTRLGNLQTERLTHDLVNCIRIFNLNFSFQLLIQLLSIMLHQISAHPYPSALPIIFNSFLAALLGLPYHG